MAIFALAVGVLAQAANNGLSALIMMQERKTRTADMMFLREKILSIADKTEMETGGEIYTPVSGSVSWEATVYPTTAADLFFVTLIFDFPLSDELPQEEITKTFYLYRPKWSEAAERTELLEEFDDLLNHLRPRRKMQTDYAQ